MVKRWAVMLVVMGLVLGSMGAVLAEEGVEAEQAKEPPAPGSEAFELLDRLLDPFFTLVLFWGDGVPDLPQPCESIGDGSGGSIFLPGQAAGDADECALNVEGPNGQVNHGSMVSAFVHWLKSDAAAGTLEAADVPKGHLVRQMAKNDFGKGNYEFETEDGEGTELDPANPGLELEEAEEDDGNGPPAWVLEKKADKVKGKKK